MRAWKNYFPLQHQSSICSKRLLHNSGGILCSSSKVCLTVSAPPPPLWACCLCFWPIIWPHVLSHWAFNSSLKLFANQVFFLYGKPYLQYEVLAICSIRGRATDRCQRSDPPGFSTVNNAVLKYAKICKVFSTSVWTAIQESPQALWLSKGGTLRWHRWPDQCETMNSIFGVPEIGSP